MKILAIADVHGKKTWIDIINENPSDQIIFLGDYVDTRFMLSDTEIYNNLVDIIAYTKTHDNVTLLLGNHDIAYINKSLISGYVHHMEVPYSKLLNDTIFKRCKIVNNYIFSHAGFTNTWVNTYVNGEFTEENINNVSLHTFETCGPCRGGYQIPGPVWCDIRELRVDSLSGYTQVIGHTPTEVAKIQSTTGETIYTVDIYDKEKIGYKLLNI